MKLKLHHVNLATTNVPQMDQFYRDVIGLEPEDDTLLPAVDQENGIVGNVAFVTDGDIQMHLAQKDTTLGLRTGKMVNPLSRGHIAYRTDDIAAFKAHLEAEDIPYSDWGDTAVAGWHQIFFYDPDGNVIEVHQVCDDDLADGSDFKGS